MEKGKRIQNSIDIKTKLLILQDVDKREINKSAIAEKYKIPKSTLSTIIKNRDQIEKNVAFGSFVPTTKRMRTANFEDVEHELLEWFNHIRSSNLPISGPIIQSKAKEIATMFGIENFDCSSGWLWRFKKRHGIVSLKMCGEAAKVSDTTTSEWLSTFNIIKMAYSPKDVFNMDETGLFYNLLPNKTLDYKGKKCHGGAKSKQRLTVVLCCNSDGSEKHKAWVIGKSSNPRCFRNFNRTHLPCEYSCHSSSWIDSKAFGQWLIRFNTRMIAQNRKILLTLDNCAAHKVNMYELSNIKIVFFPANTTSHLQPLDQGIIANFKSEYKGRLVRFAIRALETEGQILKWDVLQAIRAIAAAWSSVTEETIRKCFVKAWSLSDSPSIVENQDTNILPEEWNILISMQPLDVSFDDFLNVDEDLSVCAEPSIAGNMGDEGMNLDSQNISSDESDYEINVKPTKEEVMSALSVLQRFAATTEVSDKFDVNLEFISREIMLKTKPILVQKKIHDYFKK